MININTDKVPLKNLIVYNNSECTKYDMLYEIVQFLSNEQKETFTEAEAKSKTKSRTGTFDDNFAELINEGFIAKDKYSKYKLIKHLWA